MILKIKPIINVELYNDFQNYKNDKNEIILNNNQTIIKFLTQNEKIKNKINNENYFTKKIKKSLNSFKNLVEQIGFDNPIKSGYLIDYSNYIEIFLIAKNQNELIYHVEDTCLARGEKFEANFNNSLNFLKNEKVVVSEIIEIIFKQKEWLNLISKYIN